MNKYLYILASLAFAAVSCTNLQEEDLLLEEEDEKVEITAGINIESGFATKTYISPVHDVTQGTQYPVLWSAKDKIALISDKVSVFQIDSTNTTSEGISYGKGCTNAKFSGSASALSGKFPGTKGYPAAYPTEGAEAFLPVDGKFMVGSYLPAKQSFVDGSFDDNVFPMAAVSTDGINYNFENLCGIVQINIQSDASVDESKGPQKIRAIYFYGNDGEEVAGGIGMWFDAKTGEAVSSTVYKDNGKKVEAFGDESNEKLIIDFGANLLPLSKTDVTSINLAVLPQTFSKGFTVEVVDKNMGSTYYKTDSITIKRSMIKEITPVIDYIAPEPIEIANCYIYDEPGTYLMPAFAMGNRLDVRIDVAKHPNLNADLLWTDIINPDGTKKDFISDLEYIKMDDGNNMMQFKINADPATGEAYRGNAMIALYDEDTKEILWTWHLWLTDYHDVITGGSCADGSYDFTYSIAGSEYEGHFKGDASSGKLIILDRNIGATAATPDECNGEIWRTYGLYYQDGRKDPFIGGHYNGDILAGSTSYSMEEVMKSGRPDETSPFVAVDDGGYGTAKTWWNNVLAPKGWNWKNGFLNVSQSIQNPMCYSSGILSNNNPQWTLYTDPDNKSWLNQSVATKGKNHGGDATSGTHGSTGLADAGHEAYWNRTKTIMDPCPVGYTVLGERKGKLINNDTNNFDSSNPYGVTTTFSYSGTSYSTWWPAAGVRTIDGKIADVGHYGAYFYYDHISATHGGHGMLFEITTNKGTTGITWKVKANAENGGVITGHSTPIRCVRAKQFNSSGQPSPALK
ncbi:MAG: hypothetical protein MJY84_02060 [Bacteroidales bacterium]|nr:hypothetical protein [Bacteroidales bacterium]